VRLAVVGSRDYPRLEEVAAYLDEVRYMGEDEPECIVSGGARGVDQAAEAWAREHQVPVVSFRPAKRAPTNWYIERWETAGPGHTVHVLPGSYETFAAAAFVRNGFIVEFADQVVAFHYGKSHGTRDSIARARHAGNLRDVVHG
jgi:hypothetical protein